MGKDCWNGCRLGVVLSVVILLAGGCNDGGSRQRQSRWVRSAQRDISALPGQVWEDSKVTFTRGDNLAALAIAGGASIVMNDGPTDERADDWAARHDTFTGFSDEALNIIGSPGTHFAVTGLWYALSAENQDILNKNRAWTMMRALSLNGLVTIGLKAARDEPTPNDKGWGWPSGHTSSSFCVAAVLDEFYGPGVGIPAYVVAGAVGYRMYDTHDHWASDVVFGATLGWIVGHTVAGQEKLEVAGFEVIPGMVSNGYDAGAGVMLIKRF